MPISAAALFETVGLGVQGSTPWGTPPRTAEPGVYVLSLSRDASRNDDVMATAPICLKAVAGWLARVPGFELDGRPAPRPEDVAACLSSFWLPDESIVYVGKATSLAERTSSFFCHKLGRRSPHAGGHWIKTLSCLDRMMLHFCECDSAD